MTGKTLKAFREKMRGRGVKALPKTYYKCTNCNSISYSWAGRCASCGEWNTLKQVNSSKKSKKTKSSKQEVSHEYIMDYLKTKKLQGLPIKIYYKEDKLPTVFYSYTFDNKYIYVPSGQGYNYKYLVERVRNVQQ